jgi:aryl-alcohol dehydrogenase-like predicted oxidoreductase
MTTRNVDASLSGTFSLGGDLPVYRLGFGAMRITGPGVWGPPLDRDEAVATLRRSVERGVTLIDTADSYGPYVSEELIAEALYPYQARLVIATKGGFDRPGPDRWETNGRPEHLREALDGSLKRLRLDRIDLYQLHRIDPAVAEEEQFGFLQRAQEAGKIRHIGLSEVSVEEIRRAQQFFSVASVQNRYNLVERRWESVLEYCEREQIAFIPWYPLQVGRIARPDGAIALVAERHHATPAQIALAWLLRRSTVVLPIPGTSRRDHLDENVAAADIELSRDEFATLG